MKQKLLVILGPTSTGKTDLALNLAKKLNGELVSADSRQVYKYLDIGTGKEGSIKYQVLRGKGYWAVSQIKIWMYDVVDPEKRFNLYKYILKAEKILYKISRYGKLPILVGGTGLYIRSSLEGVSDFGTDANPELRLELENLKNDEIKKRINEINPEILKQLNNSEINNKRRLTRLLEKLTVHKTAEKSFPGIEKNYDVLKIGLTASREILREKIRTRVLSRIDQGMIEESKNLLAREILNYKRLEELGLEYRYIARYLKGEIETLDELVNILRLKICQFAKRQETWFKREKNVNWFNIQDSDYIVQVEKQVMDWYNNSPSE